MAFYSHPDIASTLNVTSTYGSFQVGGQSGADHQIMQAQTGNRTLTLGNQCLSSSGGTGGVSGGSAGPGGGSAGAVGAGSGTAGGGSGSAGGPPSGGQETGDYNPTGTPPTRPDSRDNVDPQVISASSHGAGVSINDMTYPTLAAFLGKPRKPKSKLGGTCPISRK